MFSKFWVILPAIGLSACTGASISPEEKLGRDFEAAIAQENRLKSYAGTVWSAMPESGSATFKGYGSLVIDPVEDDSYDDLIIIGATDMRANFANGTFRGAMTDMSGASEFTDTTAFYFDVGGEIAIGDRVSIIGDDFDDNLTNKPNDWYADFLGTISTPYGDFTLEGTLEGLFVGTRINNPTAQSPMKGFYGGSTFGYAVYGSSEFPVYMFVTGEN